MSDPQPRPGRRQPPRAEPLQPDRPLGGSGGEDVADAEDDATIAKRHEQDQREQNEAAHRNVREGYD